MSPVTIQEYSNFGIILSAAGAITTIIIVTIFVAAFNELTEPKTPPSETKEVNQNQKQKGRYILPSLGVAIFIAGIAVTIAGAFKHEDAREAATQAFFTEVEDATGVNLLGKNLYSYSDLVRSSENSIDIRYTHESAVFEGIILIQENQGQLMIPVNAKEDHYVPFDEKLLTSAH